MYINARNIAAKYHVRTKVYIECELDNTTSKGIEYPIICQANRNYTYYMCFSKTIIGDSSELPKWFISQM